MDCIFCKIANHEVPCKKAYEDDTVIAFYDAEPQAPVHILLIPKAHIESVAQINEKNSAVVAHIYEVASRLARAFRMYDGFRIVCNFGKDGGQTVPHLHFHLLGGRKMKWPPG